MNDCDHKLEREECVCVCVPLATKNTGIHGELVDDGSGLGLDT